MKKYSGLIFLGISLLVLVVIGFLLNNQQNSQKSNLILGGETDSYGCLIPSGFSYDSEIDACVRDWEISPSEKEAAKLSVNFVGSSFGLSVNAVERGECSSCFSVHLQKSNDKVIVMIQDGRVRRVMSE